MGRLLTGGTAVFLAIGGEFVSGPQAAIEFDLTFALEIRFPLRL